MKEESQTHGMSKKTLFVDNIDDSQFELSAEAKLPSSPTLKAIREEEERQEKSVKGSQGSKAPWFKMITRPKSNGNDVQFAPFHHPVQVLRKDRKSPASGQINMKFGPIKTHADAVPDGLPNEARLQSHSPDTR